MRESRKRSGQVRLVVLGSVVLGGCGPDLPNDRYVYDNRGQCVQDWGEVQCEPGPSTSSGGGYFYGPRFNSYVRTPDGRDMWTGTRDRVAVSPSTGRIVGNDAINVSRGGFGSSGHSFSSGG